MADEKQVQKMHIRVVDSEPYQSPIEKAEVETQLTPEEQYAAGDWITRPLNAHGFKALVDNSTILPQCIRAYKSNIAGFGIGVKYKEDVEETKEMAEEFEKMQEVIDLLTIECDTKEVFEHIISARETYGIAYLEVIRTLEGDVVQIDYIKDVPEMEKTKPLEPYLDTTFYYKGKAVTRKKKFRKYRQTVGGETVYFKEFGDPRPMDMRDGTYHEADGVERQYQANEILEFKLGDAPYGEIRWMGQVMGADGSRRAENLNLNYFINGRHTPLMIMIENGTLSDESFAELQHYINDIRGEAGQHAFMILEVESTDGRTDFDTTTHPTVQVKELANVLQKDELFQDYLDNHRKKMQSAFQLPDLYVAYTTDYNRATAQTAMEVTEEQVFQPERASLAWMINNKLLNGYNFKYVEAYFREPNISNPDDTYKMLNVLSNAGGLTMNKAKDLLYRLYGEVSEDYDADWGNLPISMARSATTGNVDAEALATIMAKTSGQINKAESDGANDEVVAVMKEVRRLLEEMQANDQEGGEDHVSELPEPEEGN